MLRVFATLFLTFGAVGAAQGKSPIVVKAGHTKELCGEAYADAQIAMSDKVRELENHASYARLVQTEVQYETPYYGSDGRIQQRRSKGAFFGTAFAYMRRGDEVFFLSNAHVVSSPPVTSTDTRVDGVPPGSRKVQEESWIVERDGDGVVKIMKLTRVAVDLATDSAVLRARWPQKAQKPTDPTIEVMPYKIGRSADLHVGNFVYVRGYPLGAFQAVNVGRVTNPFDDDREGHWNHSDFIVDALHAWWEQRPLPQRDGISLLQIKADNVPESNGWRTQFLHRMVQFAYTIGKPIQLLYYPPYHSKYSPIERCWGFSSSIGTAPS